MLVEVQGAGGTDSRAFHDVEVDHGGGDVGMAEEILHGADVGTGFKQMGCKTVAQTMR